jgi:hypothetical protein
MQSSRQPDLFCYEIELEEFLRIVLRTVAVELSKLGHETGNSALEVSSERLVIRDVLSATALESRVGGPSLSSPQFDQSHSTVTPGACGPPRQ